MKKGNTITDNVELTIQNAADSTLNHGKITSSVLKLFDLVYRNTKSLLSIYLVTVVVSILFALKQGDDIAFHLQRLDAIIKEVQHEGLSAFPIRIYHSTAYGFGYASPMFYGDIFMWPFAILAVLLNLKVLCAYKIMLSVTFIIAWLIARFSFGLILRGQQRDVAVFLYMVSVTIYGDATGSCVGRDFATMFVPLCLCCFFCILYGEKESQWKCGILLSLGMSGLLYSNLLDSVIVAFSLLWIMLFSFRKITIRKMVVIFSAAILCLGLSAWFIFPMIEQMASQIFFVTSEEVNQGMNNLHELTMPFVGIFLPARAATILYRIIGLEVHFAWAYFYGMLFYLVLTAILIAKYRDIFDKSSGEYSFYISIAILLFLFCIFQTKLFPHQLFSKIIGTMQFPWRVAIVMTCIGCLFAVRILQTTHKSLFISILMIVSLCCVIISGLSSYGISLASSVIKGTPFADYSYSSDSVGNGEYLPLEFLNGTDRYAWKEDLITRGLTVTCDNSETVFTTEKTFDCVFVEYSNDSNAATFELPLIYYKGYIAEDVESGEKLTIEKSKAGLVCVKTDRKAGTIAVTYGGTDIQSISERISFVTGMLLIGSIFYIKYRRRCKSS